MRVAHVLGSMWLIACGGDDGGGMGEQAGALDMMPDLIAALPSFQAARVARTPATGDPIQDGMILGRFKLECHGDDVALQNDCPAGVPLDLSTKYSGDTVLGLIAGAQMNANQILQHAFIGTCDVDNLVTTARPVTLAAFVSDDPDGDGGRYLIDDMSRLGCVAEVAPSRWAAWAIPDGSRREVVTLVKGALQGTTEQSFINQTVILLDAAGSPRVIALNDVNLTTNPPSYVGNGRALVIANLVNRRFLLKTSGGAMVLGVVAAGQAGLSPAGIASPGVFFARAETGYCIDNETKAEADAASCATEAAPWVDAMTPGSYLALSAEDAVLLAPHLAAFADGATASVIPTASVPSGVADKIHFPDRIQ